MCNFCPLGVIDPDIVLPTDDGTTCAIAAEYAVTLTAEDDMCPTVLMAESLCCPPKEEEEEEEDYDNIMGDSLTQPPTGVPPCEDGTIVDIVTNNDDFSTLVAALTASGMLENLALFEDGPFTVFGMLLFLYKKVLFTHNML